ncbi:DUF6197 family protein [Streptomyces albidoflavus]|uniref:DUF6197 family protein n=1 Tax=Streptomyces albidoflavus TaxID=1886 RepID=UPI00188C433D|nr:hypothetical protein [Streptomyces albidoflavus]MBF4138157.1 hypothetical protein [Streptomyces albidoflavus]MBZ2410792.1 hypothetical protein [Streptomyces sp. L06]
MNIFYDDLPEAAVTELGLGKTMTTFWSGPSGETVAGEAVADHLTAAADLLTDTGWTRTTPPAPQPAPLPALDEATSVREMLSTIYNVLRTLVDEEQPKAPQTLSSAICRTQQTHGDPDTAWVGQAVLTAILRAHTRSLHVSLYAWAEKQHRSQDQIAQLLLAGAAFARRYGPDTTDTPTAA